MLLMIGLSPCAFLALPAPTLEFREAEDIPQVGRHHLEFLGTLPGLFYVSNK